MARECPLGLLNLLFEFSKSAKVLGDIGASLLLVRLDQVLDDMVVKIFEVEPGSVDLTIHRFQVESPEVIGKQ